MSGKQFLLLHLFLRSRHSNGHDCFYCCLLWCCFLRLTGVILVLQVLLAAGDTFRAAAAEQLQLWAGRMGLPVHAATREKARPDNVLYEAVSKVSSALIVWQSSTGSSRVHKVSARTELQLR